MSDANTPEKGLTKGNFSHRMTFLGSLRFWLITLLAGKCVVMLNLKITVKPGEHYLFIEEVDGLIIGRCDFDPPPHYGFSLRQNK